MILPLVVLEGLVLLQGMLAWRGGTLTMRQMERRGASRGYSFLQHGGMWGDAFLVSPLVAYLISRYPFPYLSLWGLVLFAASLVAWIVLLLKVYAPASVEMPEAHAFGGKVEPAGWVHVAYAVPVTWVVLMTYFTPVHVLRGDLLLAAAALTFWSYLGAKKFSLHWTYREARIQVPLALFVIWGATVWHLL